MCFHYVVRLFSYPNMNCLLHKQRHFFVVVTWYTTWKCDKCSILENANGLHLIWIFYIKTVSGSPSDVKISQTFRLQKFLHVHNTKHCLLLFFKLQRKVNLVETNYLCHHQGRCRSPRPHSHVSIRRRHWSGQQCPCHRSTAALPRVAPNLPLSGGKLVSCLVSASLSWPRRPPRTLGQTVSVDGGSFVLRGVSVIQQQLTQYSDWFCCLTNCITSRMQSTLELLKLINSFHCDNLGCTFAEWNYHVSGAKFEAFSSPYPSQNRNRCQHG